MANDEQNPVVPPVLTVVPAIPAVAPVVEAVAAPVAATPAPAVVAPVVQEIVTAPVQAAVTQVAAPVLSFSEKLEAGVGYLWKNDKVFLVVFGVLILIGYVSGTLMDLITSKSNKDVDKTQAKDADLKAKEDSAKAQAANYEQAAKDAATNEPQVGEDWNVKK